MSERLIGLAALTVLDVSPANQVIVAAEAGYTHVGLRLISATPTDPSMQRLETRHLFEKLKND